MYRILAIRIHYISWDVTSRILSIIAFVSVLVKFTKLNTIYYILYYMIYLVEIQYLRKDLQQ